VEKQRYYVYMATNEILPQPGDSDRYFEIDATDEEMAGLQDLFDRMDDEEQHSLVRASTPYERFDTLQSGDQDERNEPFDRRMRDIYWKIYDLGTPETRSQIEEMGILKLQS
jgi:hypothetical protein